MIVGFIGCGNMGGALLRAVIRNIGAQNCCVSEKAPEKAEKVTEEKPQTVKEPEKEEAEEEIPPIEEENAPPAEQAESAEGDTPMPVISFGKLESELCPSVALFGKGLDPGFIEGRESGLGCREISRHNHANNDYHKIGH